MRNMFSLAYYRNWVSIIYLHIVYLQFTKLLFYI